MSKNRSQNQESGNSAVLDVAPPVIVETVTPSASVDAVTPIEAKALESATVETVTPSDALPVVSCVVAIVAGTMESERAQLAQAVRVAASGMMGARAFLWRKVGEYVTRWKIENSVKAIQAHFALFTFTDGTKLSEDFLASCARAESQRKAADKLGLATFNAWKNSMTEKDASAVVNVALGKQKKAVTPKTALQRMEAAYAKLNADDRRAFASFIVASEALHTKNNVKA